MNTAAKLAALPDDTRPKPGLVRTWAAVWVFLFVTWTAFIAAAALVYLSLRWLW